MSGFRLQRFQFLSPEAHFTPLCPFCRPACPSSTSLCWTSQSHSTGLSLSLTLPFSARASDADEMRAHSTLSARNNFDLLSSFFFWHGTGSLQMFSNLPEVAEVVVVCESEYRPLFLGQSPPTKAYIYILCF